MPQTEKLAVITVQGSVQGVGFRPFVFRLAKRLGLKGRVHNAVGGVVIEIEGDRINQFLKALESEPPKLARIESINIENRPLKNFTDFQIIASGGTTEATPQIMPDVATCPDCRNEINESHNRRFSYAFTNCTQCGPRFSIIVKPPYDRVRTTMAGFTMCEDCNREYHDPDDRRFHAQPNCCPKCGPTLTLLTNCGKDLAIDDPLAEAVRLLQAGKILAIKGIGGFHLGCDATNQNAVLELRRRKNRPDKPFALMVGSVEQAKTFGRVDSFEEALLNSVPAPILLLAKKNGHTAPAVAPANGYVGVMIAYAPLHHLLFNQGISPLVMTSGNVQDEPILTTEQEVLTKLPGVVDFILTHNRPIQNRSDDSVIFYSSRPVLVRRARGYAPAPIRSPFKLKASLACGAEQKNTFALGRENKVYLSPHIGDLDSQSSLGFFQEMLAKYIHWFKIEPELVACDLHPDYLSTRYAETLNKPLVRVQHHHSHVAACMADNELHEPVIGVTFDGTGLGPDGKIWGGEFLVGDYKTFERKGHLGYLPLVGGDSAIREPLRITAGYLFHLFGPDIVEQIPEIADFRTVLTQIASGMNIVQTSSMGRLFDAVSALLGLATKATFDGQAPIALESIALEAIDSTYPFTINNFILDPKPIFQGILHDRQAGEPVSAISARFHWTIIQATAAMCAQIRTDTAINSVCLGGGVFQNRLLLRGTEAELKKIGFKVYVPFRIPINDGGVSFGQIIVANCQNL